MRKGGGKSKGGAFEREIAKLLSRWVTNGERDDVFWRSSLSGGRATVARKKRIDNRQSGDITAVAPEGHIWTDNWFIECKFYADLDLVGFIFHDRGKLARFWKQACQQAHAHKKNPMLIAKQNRMDPLLIVRTRDHFTFMLEDKSSTRQMRPSKYDGRVPHIFWFNDLLKTEPPK